MATETKRKAASDQGIQTEEEEAEEEGEEE